jgi:hypothetical protein
MSLVLLVLGILMSGAGIVTIGFGISISEPGLGNALIVAGTTSLGAGVILIGLSAAVSQLVQIAQVLRSRAGSRPAVRPPGTAEPPAVAPVRTVAPRPSAAARPRPEAKVEEPVPAPGIAEPAPELSALAIERLRTSLLRPERKPAETTQTEPVPLPLPPDLGLPSLPAEAGRGSNGATPPWSAPEAEPPKPRLDFLFRSKAREVPSESFDLVWPKRAQPTNDEGQSRETTKPAALPAGRAWPPEAPPAPAPEAGEAPRTLAILRSGVVDGMAYTLYVDGSIEAQLPQGTVRFGSIAELRAHIENNS